MAKYIISMKSFKVEIEEDEDPEVALNDILQNHVKNGNYKVRKIE